MEYLGAVLATGVILIVNFITVCHAYKGGLDDNNEIACITE
jgi:hypothetical protein